MQRSECDPGSSPAVKKCEGGKDCFQVFMSLRVPPSLGPSQRSWAPLS